MMVIYIIIIDHHRRGIWQQNVLHVPAGHISLYEVNVDRPSGQLIYPFITKQSSNAAFRTVAATTYSSDFVYGDVMV